MKKINTILTTMIATLIAIGAFLVKDILGVTDVIHNIFKW